MFIDHQGHRKAKRMGEGRSGRRAAEQAAEKISARLVLGELHLDKSSISTLQEYAERWLQSSARSHKMRTEESYTQRLHTVWLSALGSRRLDQITRAHVKKVIA